jgi:hypothetical protein
MLQITNKIIRYLIVTIFCLILTGCGRKIENRIKPIENINTPAGIQLSTSTVNSTNTADWQTYRDNQDGFEFRYPNNFNLFDEPFTGPRLINNKTKGEINPCGFARNADYEYENTLRKAVEYWAKEYFDFSDAKNLTFEEINDENGELLGYFSKWEIEGEENNVNYRVDFERIIDDTRKDSFKIVYGFCSSADEVDEDVFKQIFNTFKFIN